MKNKLSSFYALGFFALFMLLTNFSKAQEVLLDGTFVGIESEQALAVGSISNSGNTTLNTQNSNAQMRILLAQLNENLESPVEIGDHFTAVGILLSNGTIEVTEIMNYVARGGGLKRWRVPQNAR